jgi:hypothetical protein
MPDLQYPTRLRILMKLTEILQGITVANGYKHDLGPTAEWPDGKVFRGRVLFGEGDPLPMISILEVPVPPEQIPSAPDNPDRYGSWELILQGFVEDDPTHPTDPAQMLQADVVQRLAVEKRKSLNFSLFDMGKTVTSLNVGVGVVRPPDELSAKAYFWLPLRLMVAEHLDKPYADADQ